MKYTTLLRATLASLSATFALAATTGHADMLAEALELNGGYVKLETGPAGQEWTARFNQQAVEGEAAIAGSVDVSSPDTSRSYLQMAVQGPGTISFSWFHEGEGALRFYMAHDTGGEIEYQPMGTCNSSAWVVYPEFNLPNGLFWLAWQYEATSAGGTYQAGLDNIDISVQTDPHFPDATFGPNGELESPWFGKLWQMDSVHELYYHNYHGYIYILDNGGPNFWYYDLDSADYLYTDSSMYPYMWSQNEDWIYFMEASSTPGQRPWIYNLNTDEMYQYPR